MKPGTQIIYVPTHAHGNLGHQDVEHGFVTSAGKTDAFCRYWSKADPSTLRTRGNSELAPIDMLLVTNTRPQSIVDAKLDEIRNETVSETHY